MKIFFDENFSKYLARGFNCFQGGYRSENIEVRHIGEEFGTGIEDEKWIPAVAQIHGVAITQDFNIHRIKHLYSLCQHNKLGIFFFKPPGKRPYTYWESIFNVLKYWRDVKEISKHEPKPFGYVIKPRCKFPEKLL